jgi:hypothetical protein
VALQTAFGLLAVTSLVSPLWAALPFSLALSSAGVMAAAGTPDAGSATAMQRAGLGAGAFRVFCIALLAAAISSGAIGLLEVFAPMLADGDLGRPNLASRPGGRQHAPAQPFRAALLLWGVIATAWLADAGILRRIAMWAPG